MARFLSIMLFIFLLRPAMADAAVPFWGAKKSSAADTKAAQLKPGEWVWGGDNKTMGPMTAIVGLTKQPIHLNEIE